jgi:bacillithiol system protein YtxJ
MHRQMMRLERLDQLERALAGSAERPLLLFKHSYTCGISAEALDELRGMLATAPTAADYAIVTVQTHRDVSDAVTRELGVRHETPQALLVRDGRVVWSASHFRVTGLAVAAAINAATPPRLPATPPIPTTTPTES